MKEDKNGTVVVEFHRSTGKYGDEFFEYLEAERMRKHKNSSELPTIFHVITKKEIENCNPQRLLRKFGLSLPARELRKIHGRVHFAIEGYDAAEEELCEIPAVRKFIRRSCTAWGGWHFFSSLETSWLRLIACCQVERLRVVKSAGCSLFMVGMDGTDWVSYYNDTLLTFAQFSFQAEIPLKQGIKYIKQLAEHLGLGPED